MANNSVNNVCCMAAKVFNSKHLCKIWCIFPGEENFSFSNE
jgi:hypothetical protein